MTNAVCSRSSADDFLRREADVGSFASAVYAVGSPDGVDCEGALGNAVAVPFRIPATLDTIYDVASLTKPLITATLILQAVEEKRITLDDRYEGFTFRELLTHTSGLTAWLPMYAYGSSSGSSGSSVPRRTDRGTRGTEEPRNQYLTAIREHGREADPGTRVIYSDLNFVLLYFAIEQLFGDYVAAAQSRIFDRIGVRDALFRPPAAVKPRIAATEWGQRYEMKMCAERGIGFDGFRQTLIWGETHDGNSYFLGGTAGNAGLFATARAVYRITQAFVRGELVSLPLVREAIAGESRGLGWDKPSAGSEATSMLSRDAFGHTGFTGTSVWVDRDRIMVLLTNRVHPCAAPIAMQRIRGEFHRLVQ